MSAALQFPALARAAAAQRAAEIHRNTSGGGEEAAASQARPAEGGISALRATDPRGAKAAGVPCPTPNLAFYHKHTQALLRRYLYASMLVGRAPSILTEPLMRGWASYRPVETFEDSVIFVLDMESALARLPQLDRLLLTRVVLQEYSIGETALLLQQGHRRIYRCLADALDRLTEILLKNGILEVPGRLGEDLED